MADQDVAPGRLSRLRASLKSFAYSGFRRGRWQDPDRVIEALALGAGSRVADLGAGGGYFTFRLSRAVGADGVVYAIDTDPDMVRHIADRATRHRQRNVVTVSVEPGGPPALPESVDLVLLVDVFHHLDDARAAAAALAGQLRPGGRVAVIEAIPKWSRFGHATEPGRIRSVMAEAGYSLQHQHTFLPQQSFQVFIPTS